MDRSMNFSREFDMWAKQCLQFNERTGLYMHYEEFEGLSIQPETALGLFSRRSLPRLKKFVKENPEFHILSSCGEFTYNYLKENCYTFMLGDGDPNPTLKQHNRGKENLREILEFYSNESATKIS